MKRIILFSVLMLLFIAGLARAAPTRAQQAEKVVKGWLKTDAQPLGAVLGRKIMKVESFSGSDGQPIYYVVYLQPSGFVIVPADDLVEPIVGFADDGTYDPSSNNPLGALVSRDLPSRIAAVRGLQTAARGQTKKKALNKQRAAFQKASLEAQSKWSDLQTWDDKVITLGESSISAVRVSPLVASDWGQEEEYHWLEGWVPCYNYYTPNNYPSGCVATAMAQLMLYHEHPTYPISTGPFTIYVNGSPQTAYLLGGPYDWDNMLFKYNLSNGK